MMKIVKIKTTDIENLKTATFCRCKSYIGRYCRLPPPILMAVVVSSVCDTLSTKNDYTKNRTIKFTGKKKSSRKF